MSDFTVQDVTVRVSKFTDAEGHVLYSAQLIQGHSTIGNRSMGYSKVEHAFRDAGQEYAAWQRRVESRCAQNVE